VWRYRKAGAFEVGCIRKILDSRLAIKSSSVSSIIKEPDYCASSLTVKRFYMIKKTIFFAVLCFLLCDAFAQEPAKKPRFWADVQTIKKYDKMFAVPPHPIVFVGSSSIRKWDNLQVDFGKYNVLNRGVGGTVLDEITFYLNDLVFPYQPRQIVLYVGENDVTKEENTADSILNKTIRLYTAIRAKMPSVPVVYIGMKPSPSREKYVQKVKEANRLIKAFLAKEPNTAFVEIFSLMLTKDGKMRPELFVSDMLHMKPEGYAIWKKAVEPYLLKQ
jgi:lysophospholipase L1-like esterase